MSFVARAESAGGMGFDIDLQGHKLRVDADPAFGGTNSGPRPKSLLLAGLAGCTGMDVVSILGKMRMPFDSFAVEVDADTAEEHPKVYTRVHLRYIFSGAALDRAKIEKAVRLSMDTYCGVTATLRHTADIDYEIVTE